VRLVWQQVEALLPAVMDAIFQSADGIFFDCFPRPGTSPQQAINTREVMASQLDEANIWETIRKVVKCSVFHGTGILKDTWLRTDREREYWSDELVPTMTRKDSATDRYQTAVQETPETQRTNQSPRHQLCKHPRLLH
jgi:hypothetical protein